MEKKIKIIDLLNKIANGEQPKRFKWNDELFELDEERKIYFDSEDFPMTDSLKYNLSNLNDEVEILDEEDEFEDIEEMNFTYGCDTENKIEANFERHRDYINSLIKNQKKIISRLKDE